MTPSVFRRSASRLSSIVLVGLLTACQDAVTDPLRPGQPGAAADVSQRPIRAGEARQERLAREVPGFAGYHYDTLGNAIILLVGDRGIGQARSAMARELSEVPPGRGRRGTVIVRRADYTFAQLAAWRDRASNDVLGTVKGLVEVDLDEEHNRVGIGHLTEQPTGEMRAALAAVGIPAAAIRFYPTEEVRLEVGNPATTPVHTASMTMTGPTLRDRLEPAAGGARIHVVHAFGGGSAGICTMGFTVENTRVAGARNDWITFMTASHCSSKQFGYDGASYYQPTYTYPNDPYTYIGDEVYDPNYFICCVAKYRTRWSDVLLADIRNSARNTAKALVHKTTYSSIGRSGGVPGSIDIDVAHPYWYVVGEEQSVPVNTFLMKVGQTTGWTEGYVAVSCADRWHADGWKLLCNTLAKYWSNDGDSGAPVFMGAPGYGPEYVKMVGIHWGSFGGTSGSATISPMGNIQRSDEIGEVFIY